MGMVILFSDCSEAKATAIPRLLEPLSLEITLSMIGEIIEVTKKSKTIKGRVSFVVKVFSSTNLWVNSGLMTAVIS